MEVRRLIHVLHALIAGFAATHPVRFACPWTYPDLRLGPRTRRIVKAGHTSRRQHREFTFTLGKRCLRALGNVPTRPGTEPSHKTAHEECTGKLWNNCRGPRIPSILSHVRERGAHGAHLPGRTGNGSGCWATRGRATWYSNNPGWMGAIELLCRT